MSPLRKALGVSAVRRAFRFSPFSHAEIVLRRVENVGDFEKTYFEARKDFDLRILKSESEYAVATGALRGVVRKLPS